MDAVRRSHTKENRKESQGKKKSSPNTVEKDLCSSSWVTRNPESIPCLPQYIAPKYLRTSLKHSNACELKGNSAIQEDRKGQ